MEVLAETAGHEETKESKSTDNKSGLYVVISQVPDSKGEGILM